MGMYRYAIQGQRKSTLGFSAGTSLRHSRGEIGPYLETHKGDHGLQAGLAAIRQREVSFNAVVTRINDKSFCWHMVSEEASGQVSTRTNILAGAPEPGSLSCTKCYPRPSIFEARARELGGTNVRGASN